MCWKDIVWNCDNIDSAAELMLQKQNPSRLHLLIRKLYQIYRNVSLFSRGYDIHSYIFYPTRNMFSYNTTPMPHMYTVCIPGYIRHCGVVLDKTFKSKISLIYLLWCYVLLQMRFLHYGLINSSPPSAAYVSVNRVSIGSHNGLSRIRCQDII